MKLFTVEEANLLLPRAQKILLKIQRSYARVVSHKEEAQRAAAGAESGGGGMTGGTNYLIALTELAERTDELDSLGIQLKDFELGLIDFPTMRDNRIVLLCWKLGEGDRIEWWHEMEAGYAGRQPL